MEEINKKGHPRILEYIFWDGQTPIHAIDFITACNPPMIGEDIYNLKGKKVESNLLGTKNDELCVKRVFTEDYENRLLYIDFKWLNTDNTIKCVKRKSVRLTNAQWEARFRKQRERIFDDLKGRAKKYNASQYIDILYTFFKDEKQDFVETGSTLFKDSILEVLQIDLSQVPEEDRTTIATVQTILNTSLDGVVKVYQTLVALTTP